jgi:co-chaperonin GroES (HSP10)
MPQMDMHHETDPKQEIIDAVGDLEGFDLVNMKVLVGIYIRPQKTKSGIILTDRTVDEDRYQGKVGLILKTGPRAFVDPKGEWFEGRTFSVGDWVVLKPSDGWAITINGHPCRILDDVVIQSKETRPDRVW